MTTEVRWESIITQLRVTLTGLRIGRKSHNFEEGNNLRLFVKHLKGKIKSLEENLMVGPWNHALVCSHHTSVILGTCRIINDCSFQPRWLWTKSASTSSMPPIRLGEVNLTYGPNGTFFLFQPIHYNGPCNLTWDSSIVFRLILIRK